ncbi:acyl--CoA ligase [Microaerobacter geothermalis]|uniref:acyl-CoA synthetase MbcS n=1 Tax=Microaerobacter geothermalis TaxID=674972 RepID=UPI001F3755AE|nr:acyl--CoA ligase [Microaerobacter geothermalis]MCF6094983.1 acyl--CoA ligase [Microaerobacter geothermalis]
MEEFKNNLIAPDFYNMAEDIDKHGDDQTKIALYWENENGEEKILPYWKLRSESNRLGNGLKEMGLSKGDKVMILVPRTPEAYIIYLACLKLGLILMPGSELLMSKDILYRVSHAGAKGVIAHHSLTDRVDEIRGQTDTLTHFIVVGEEKEGWTSYFSLKENQSNQLEIEKTSRDDIAFLSYTSGTTGNPKGVIHTHSWAYAHQEVAAKLWLDVKPNDIVWATAGPGWAKWIWSPFISTLGIGAAGLSYLGKFEPKKYLSLLEKYQVNVLCCTPTEYRLMAKVDGLEQYDLRHLRSAVSAGEPLNREVIDTFKRYFNVEVRDGYGQTENTLLVGTLKGMEVKAGSMGQPTPGNQVAIIDDDGKPVKKGEVGDIAVNRNAPALFKGYYQDPERTSMAFRGDWYVTGDQAREDEDGYFWFEGRSDDIIISAGYTIGPFEVEDALVKHPLVAECAVVASPDEIRGSIVKAFVVLKDHSKACEDLVKELQDHVKKVTAPYKYPREIEFVTELPKTTSGKIRRVELRKMEKERKKQA